jgi:AraC-like DNA-binding protein
VDGVEAFKASFTRFSYARHTHDGYALGATDRGAMHFWHGGTQHAASDGEVIAINPGEVHDGHSDPARGCCYRMLYVERSTIEDLFAADAPRIRSTFALKGPVLRDAKLARRMRHLHAALDDEDNDPLEQHERLTQLLFRLFALYGRPPLAAPEVGREKRAVSEARHYMVEHLSETVRLTDVAAAVRLSPFYFLRTFKRSTGMPPHAYLNQIRLERARALLRAGESPAQVAAALGFADQSHLTRRFKAAFGVTPSQYRAAA